MKSIILVDARCYDANGNVFGSAFTPNLSRRRARSWRQPC